MSINFSSLEFHHSIPGLFIWSATWSIKLDSEVSLLFKITTISRFLLPVPSTTTSIVARQHFPHVLISRFITDQGIIDATFWSTVMVLPDVTRYFRWQRDLENHSHANVAIYAGIGFTLFVRLVDGGWPTVNRWHGRGALAV